MLKRCFDFWLALFGLFVSLPLWLIIFFLLYLEEGGAIFFLQERLGLNGKIFKVIKFRTINPKTGKISKFGIFLRKTALDELPQLINILKSEMSFVGPRPLIIDELELDSEYLRQRLRVKPGLTGLSQLFLSKHASVEEKIKYDLRYIHNYRLLLDIVLILKSVVITLRRRWDI